MPATGYATVWKVVPASLPAWTHDFWALLALSSVVAAAAAAARQKERALCVQRGACNVQHVAVGWLQLGLE